MQKSALALDSPAVTVRHSLAIIDRRSAVAFGLPFCLYLLTLAPTIFNLDSAELTTAAATGGLMRATGYPLYLLLGRVWSWLPVGDVGYRLNLFSAFNGALTVALAERILRRLRVGRWATAGALGLLACATHFWALSLIAEVYTLHTTLMSGLILALLYWADEPSPHRMALIGLLMGLSLGHHAAAVLLIPGCLWFLFTVASRRVLTLRALVFALGALSLGLSVYLYLPLRYGAAPAFNYAGAYDATGTFRPVNLQTPQGMWWLVSGRAFVNRMWAYSGAELWREMGEIAVQLWRSFFGIGIGPGLVGLIILLRRNWRLGGALLLMFVGNLGFYAAYRVGDKVTMYLPIYLIWALWLAVGYRWMLDWIRVGTDAPIRRWGERLLRAAMIGAVLLSLSWNWSLVDLSDDWSTREHGEALMRQLEPGALVFGSWDTIPLIQYLQLVEGQRYDVLAINRFLISRDDMCAVIARESYRRPVYSDRLCVDLLPIVEAEPVGSLFRLGPRE